MPLLFAQLRASALRTALHFASASPVRAKLLPLKSGQIMAIPSQVSPYPLPCCSSHFLALPYPFKSSPLLCGSKPCLCVSGPKLCLCSSLLIILSQCPCASSLFWSLPWLFPAPLLHIGPHQLYSPLRLINSNPIIPAPHRLRSIPYPGISQHLLALSIHVIAIALSPHLCQGASDQIFALSWPSSPFPVAASTARISSMPLQFVSLHIPSMPLHIPSAPLRCYAYLCGISRICAPLLPFQPTPLSIGGVHSFLPGPERMDFVSFLSSGACRA